MSEVRISPQFNSPEFTMTTRKLKKSRVTVWESEKTGFQRSELGHVCSKLTHIKDLAVRVLSLTSVPVEICELKSLRELSFMCNELAQLPQSFEQLQLLADLDLSYNKFITIPSVLFNLPRLKNLDMRNNPIEELDEIPVTRSQICLLYTSPSPRDRQKSRMPSSA